MEAQIVPGNDADEQLERSPLLTLLSQVLIAFTIEFDNEAERRIKESNSQPWLASMVMWSNYMRFIGEDGITVHELQALAGVSESSILSRVAALERWHYIYVNPDPADERSEPPRRDWIVTTTTSGRAAQKVWRPLPEIIEKRWHARFGNVLIGQLRDAIESVVSQVDLELPHYLPVAGNLYDDASTFPLPTAKRKDNTAPELDLSALLSQALYAFTLDFEHQFRLSLTIAANTLRVLSAKPVRLRELPGLTGVSKEAVGMSLGPLENRGFVVVEPDSTSSRGQVVRLTMEGQKAQDEYRRLLHEVEGRWWERFGKANIDRLCESLEALLGQSDGDKPRLSEGLVPPPGCWRARNPYLKRTMAFIQDPVAALPHYPMVLHRGGYPDGS